MSSVINFADKAINQKTKKAVILLALLSISAFAQGTFTDSRDGKKYKSVKISKQTWMAQNLDYQGDDGNLGKCYEDKPENCKKYGRLYNWAEAMNIDAKFNKEKWEGDTSDVKHQDVCPSGWHLPNTTEWETLVNFAGGKNEDVEKKLKDAGKKLKAKSGWNPPPTLVNQNKSAVNGTDNYGFSALPGGLGDPRGSFNWIGYDGYWWSSSSRSRYNGGYYRDRGELLEMDYSSPKIEEEDRSKMFSVRCVKD